MDKKELTNFYDCLAKTRKECLGCPDEAECNKADEQLRRLIESSEVEVGDEDTLRDNCFKALACLYIAAEKSVADDVNAKVKTYISALIRRRRTVSREWVEKWADKLHIYFFGEHADYPAKEVIVGKLMNILAELGIEVSEKEKA